MSNAGMNTGNDMKPQMNTDKHVLKANFLEKLLDRVKVEWKPLGEVLTIKNGKDHKIYKDGSIPVYGTGGIMTYIDTAVYDKPSVLIPRKGSLGNLFYVDVPFWTVDTIYWTEINTEIVDPKFVYHYLLTQYLEDLNMAGGVPSLTQTILNKVPFPIPCPDNPRKSLSIQAEIVRILDTFTELTAELIARKKQYNYYRDQLLSFEEGGMKPQMNTDGHRLRQKNHLIRVHLWFEKEKTMTDYKTRGMNTCRS